MLRDLSLLVSRQQSSLQETRFTCLLGEVRVSAPRTSLHQEATGAGWVPGCFHACP